MSNKADELQPIIVKKIKKGGGGHHGGAWKVAYADFVTAMMAFFLLMWLLNVTTEEQKNAISDYFEPTPAQVSETTSGAGGVMGGLTMSSEGAMADNKTPVTQQRYEGATAEGSKVTTRQTSLEQLKEELREKEDEAFKEKQDELENMMKNNPALQELAENLMVDMTDEGLRIQIIDQDGDPMFPSGSAKMTDKMRQILGIVSEVVIDMPNDVSVRGHTDGATYPPEATYTNWELSADRANASRFVLKGNNIPEERFANIMGKADHELLIPDDPSNVQNRRITIMMLRESLEEAMDRGAFGTVEEESTDTPFEDDGTAYDPYVDYDADLKDILPLPAPEIDKPYEKTPGAVYFP